jgi:hypothetical protein
LTKRVFTFYYFIENVMMKMPTNNNSVSEEGANSTSLAHALLTNPKNRCDFNATVLHIGDTTNAKMPLFDICVADGAQFQIMKVFSEKTKKILHVGNSYRFRSALRQSGDIPIHVVNDTIVSRIPALQVPNIVQDLASLAFHKAERAKHIERSLHDAVKSAAPSIVKGMIVNVSFFTDMTVVYDSGDLSLCMKYNMECTNEYLLSP